MVAWPLPLRTLLLSALMAPAMTWLVVPFLTRLFRSWLDTFAPRRPLSCVGPQVPEEPADGLDGPCPGHAWRNSKGSPGRDNTMASTRTQRGRAATPRR